MNQPFEPFVFSTIAKPTGSLCNLRCTYCYYLEKKHLYPGINQFRMSDKVLESFIAQNIISQDLSEVHFVWQGGEPSLLGIDFYRKALSFQRKYAGGKIIRNAFQTNGTLLNIEWCHFLRDNQFLVGISIDGPEEIHDQHRLTGSGAPTFKQVMKGIELLQKNQVEFNTLSVVHRENALQPLRIYRFLKQIGSGFIQFIPIVERAGAEPQRNGQLVPQSDRDARITEWSVIPKDYGNFLITVFDEWVRNDVARYYVQLFDATLANWVGENPGICVFSRTCGKAVAIEHNGDVYACDHYVYPEYFLGNIANNSFRALLNQPSQIKFGQDKYNALPAMCKKCPYEKACHGECPKHRFLETPEGEYGLNYLCEAYTMFFRHVSPYMDFMAAELKQQRPPSNVMKWKGPRR
jgi:uncharacterized protein